MPRRRVLVVGLDCAPPSLVFDRYAPAMPHLQRLRTAGTWGPMRSCIPPITVPAWTCMFSGRDPGELGLYGFRNREPGSYGYRVPTNRDVHHKRVWDIASEHRKRVAALFVPLTWPPSPVLGQMVSGMLTPSASHPWAYPASLKTELEGRFGPYAMDVQDFRTDDAQTRERVLRDLYRMADQHFAIARYIWTEKKPDLLTMVEIGVDRLHHAFWRFMDPGHPQYDADHPLRDVGVDYYAHVDTLLGRLLTAVEEDTTVLVVSDHGARAMEGSIAINEWLRRQGWLSLREGAPRPAPLSSENVDWSRTRAWAEGGYYARVFLNLQGREPAGIVPPDRRADELAALTQTLRDLPARSGTPLAVRAVRPDRAYREARGMPPDLLVFFDDLRIRAVSTVGTESLFSDHNDRGPDGCNHDWDGVFVMSGRELPGRGRVEGLELYDVGPTVLGLLGVPPPAEWRGRNLLRDSFFGAQPQTDRTGG